MKKIAFCGAPNVGKSKKAKELAEKKNYILVSKTLENCPLPLNLKASKQAQIFVFVTQIQQEIEKLALAEKKGLHGIVCDQCIVNSLIYSEDRGYFDLVDLLTPFVRKWLKTYTKIYWCRPKSNKIPSRRGISDLDPTWQLRIDRLFESNLLSKYGINPEQIS